VPAIVPAGPTYFVRWTRVAITALQDLASVLIATGVPIVPLRAWASQSSDAGDAQDEMLPICLQWGATTAGSGGNSFTALKQSPKAAAFGGTCRINDTTPASAGTIVEPFPDSWNVRSGFLYLPVPEERIIVDTGRLVLGLLANPADSLTCSGGIIFGELY
jgi:hypothetical protein